MKRQRLFSFYSPVNLSLLLVPGGLLLAFSLGVLWVWTISRRATHQRRQQLRLMQLKAPESGRNHASIAERVYCLNAPLNPDPRQTAVWNQWVDLQQAGPIPSTTNQEPR